MTGCSDCCPSYATGQFTALDPGETCTAETHKIFGDWISQLCDPSDKLLTQIQTEFESLEEDAHTICSDSVGHKENVTKINITGGADEEDFPPNCVSGFIYFKDGKVFNGAFKEDLSYQNGKLFESQKSDKGTTGTWVEGLLNGLVQTDNDYGGYVLTFYKHGTKHGASVEFGPIREKNFMKFCFYQNGDPVGVCFKATIGGGFMVGKMFEEKISDHHATLVLPDHKTAFTGVVVEDEFVRGHEVEVVGVKMENEMPIPILSKPSLSIIYRRDVSNSATISKFPLLQDPCEARRVVARASQVSDTAGEGLFARKQFQPGELVALYNGTRNTPSLVEEWSDYRQDSRTYYTYYTLHEKIVFAWFYFYFGLSVRVLFLSLING